MRRSITDTSNISFYACLRLWQPMRWYFNEVICQIIHRTFQQTRLCTFVIISLYFNEELYQTIHIKQYTEPSNIVFLMHILHFVKQLFLQNYFRHINEAFCQKTCEPFQCICLCLYMWSFWNMRLHFGDALVGLFIEMVSDIVHLFKRFTISKVNS